MPKGYTVNPKKDKRGLTKQEAVFVDNVPKVGIEEAAKLAYPNAASESQRVMAFETMRRPRVIHSISKIAEKQGLTKVLCVETIRDGLKATKLSGKDAVEHADHPSRLKAAELGLKLHGELKETAAAPVQLTKDAMQEVCALFWKTGYDSGRLSEPEQP